MPAHPALTLAFTASLLCSTPAPAQTTPAPAPATTGASGKLPAWDVISIRPVQVENCKNGSGVQPTANGIHVFCVPVLVVIELAYNITEPSRILGAPDWVKSSSFFDIDAKVAPGDAAA